MERDDVQTMWAAESARATTAVAVNRQLLRALAVQPTLVRIRWVSWLQLGLDGLAPILLGSFAYAHLAEPRFLAPALALTIVAIAIVHVRIRSIADARTTDYSEPVLTLQKRLESIRVRETWTTRAIFALSGLLWTPLLIVAAEAFGFDAYALGAPFLLANAAFGIVAAFTIGWLYRTYGSGRIAQALDGTTAQQARAALAAIASFESERG